MLSTAKSSLTVADLVGLRFEHDGVVAGLGDRAARGQRRQARSLAFAQAMVHGIVVHVRGARALARRVAVREHAHDGVVVGALQVLVRPGAADERIERVLVPFAACDLGDELLGQHVQRRRQHRQCIEFAAPHAIEQSSAFDQLVARLREEARLRHAADGVARAAGALQEGGDRPRRTELADQIDIADIQPEFQRRGRDEHLQLAALETALGDQPRLLRETAVVRRHDPPCRAVRRGGATRVRPCAAC